MLQRHNHDIAFGYHVDFVNVVENMPLISTEFNQSGSDFTCVNKKNKTHYREHLKTQDDDSF